MQTVYTSVFFFFQIFQAIRPKKNWFVIPGETWHNIWSCMSNVFWEMFFAAMCSVCLWRRGDRRGKGEEWQGGASPSPHPHWKDYFKQIEMFWTYHFKQISKCTTTTRSAHWSLSHKYFHLLFMWYKEWNLWTLIILASTWPNDCICRTDAVHLFSTNFQI